MEETNNQKFVVRPPVVVIMGHVDHGKSSILEAIKDLKITAKESGGITQHIGAYEIEHEGKKITFIDTPGHEAFSAMRSRGAKVADIAILVVAADEGIKPQTKEAIQHIRKAETPMIVAINKIDRPNSDPEKVKRELISNDVVVESLGGTIPSINLSAKTKQGIPELLEMILLIADVEELKADISIPAEGVIIESYINPARGPVATLILQNGILKRGENLGTPSVFGKIKGIEDFTGKSVDAALPSLPVIILGFENVPAVGEKAKVYKNFEEYRKENNTALAKSILFDFPKAAPDAKTANLIIKADVFGSLEALAEVLKTLPHEKSSIKILKAEVGEINDSDVKLAKTADAKIIGFRVKVNSAAKKSAEKEKISIINFEIIYELAQAVRNLLEKNIKPEIIRVDLGKVKILAVFKIEKNRQVIGGKVIEGTIRRGANVEVIRNGEKVGKGKLVGLQQDKKDTLEVGKRTECGMLFEGDVKIEESDILSAFVEEKKKIEL